jgi:hypothetical protein
MLNSSLKSRFAGTASFEEFGFGHHLPRGGKPGLGARRLQNARSAVWIPLKNLDAKNRGEKLRSTIAAVERSQSG